MTNMNLTEEQFERDLGDLFADKVGNEEFGRELWSALASVDWYSPITNASFSCSLRAAGALVADLVGVGDYLTYYCQSDYATVSDEIARRLKKRGWIADTIGDICDEPGCYERAGCGWAAIEGAYRTTCTEHYRGKFAKPRE